MQGAKLDDDIYSEINKRTMAEYKALEEQYRPLIEETLEVMYLQSKPNKSLDELISSKTPKFQFSDFRPGAIHSDEDLLILMDYLRTILKFIKKILCEIGRLPQRLRSFFGKK